MIVLLGFASIVAIWIVKLFLTRRVIRDTDGSAYLIRYFIWRPKDRRKRRIYLHHIMRSDHERALHDHPWHFLSIILWGSYVEITRNGKYHAARGFGRGDILMRPPTWQHRLELDKPVWTLVFVGAEERPWGFWPNGHWCFWKNYDLKSGHCAGKAVPTLGESE